MAENPRRVCVVTGSRAEYGLLFGLLKKIEAHPALALRLVVTGMHLDGRFGDTWREIESDGFPIAERVPVLSEADTPLATARAVGRGVADIAGALARVAPDVAVVLGDRFEILAAAQAALFLGIPLAHVHGGETTEGAIDDSMRHAITKMATFHFTAAEPYARRVVQMGEHPDRVFVVGALAADNIGQAELFDRTTLARTLGFDLGSPLFTVTYHPTTARSDDDMAAVMALTETLALYPGACVIITGVNADAGHVAIDQALKEFADTHPERVHCVASLGRQRYLSCVALSDAVIGNSSSGIIEAPLLGTPTVNIGDRQKGRLRAPSIIDAAPDSGSVRAALERALGKEMRAVAARRQSPYVQGNAAREIARLLATVELTPGSKSFFDLPQSMTAG